MSGYRVAHRYEETSSGVLRMTDSGVFDTEADDNPEWVQESWDQADEVNANGGKLGVKSPKAPVEDESQDESETDDEGHAEGDVEVPPKGGAGSGVQVWARYAQSKNVELTEGMTRDDIVAACEAAGVPTE